MSDEAVRSGVVYFEYTNHRGETATRKVQPVAGSLRFGTKDHYYTEPEPQWLFDAFDLEKGAERTFSVLNMQGPMRTTE